jgi:hypothetical protein
VKLITNELISTVLHNRLWTTPHEVVISLNPPFLCMDMSKKKKEKKKKKERERESMLEITM